MRIELALQLATASVSSRTIDGIATVYGVRAHASVPLVIEAGSIEIPTPTSRVKLVLDHDTTQPVGLLAEYTDAPDQLRTKFTVPPGEAGDRALTEAANGLRDGLSVGLDLADDGYTFDEDGYVHVTRATLREVTLCAVPAYDDARLIEVVASLRNTNPRGSAMPCATCGQTHAAGVACSAPTVAASAPVVTATPVPAPVPAPAPAPAVVATSAAPNPAPAVVVASASSMTLRAAAQLISSIAARGGSAQDVRAALGLAVTSALADVTPADDLGLGYTRPTWIGQLWKASQARRPFIDALGTPKPLTGLKVYGWQWDVEPQVVDYAGNKADVVGNDISTKPAEASAERTAGGWDVDRIYVDLAEPGMIEAIFEAATEDYRRKSEAKVAAKLLAGASSIATPFESLPAALVGLGQAAVTLGAEIGAVGFGSAVWGHLTGLTRDEVPWWMGSGDSISIGTVEGQVGGVKLFSSPGLASTQILGLDPRAATFYEVDPPIRVQAIDVARGGVDLGVYGYQALIINDARALIKSTVVPPA